jgi:hypothetical protein
MTLEDLMTNIDTLKKYLVEDFNEDVMVLAVNDLGVEIKDRIMSKNVLYDGSKKMYSSTPTLVGKSSFKNATTFENKVLPLIKKNVKARAKGEIKEKDQFGIKNQFYKWFTVEAGGKNVHLVLLPGGYAQIRELEGETNKYKNYFRTGEMWGLSGGTSSNESSNVGAAKFDDKFVYLGGKTTMSQNKINWNSARDKKPIIMPSEEEIKVMSDYVTKKLIERINTLLNV